MYSIYCISAVNTQHMQKPHVLVQLVYTWRHVSAVNRPSSGKQGVVLLRYSQIVCPVRPAYNVWNFRFYYTLNILIITKNFMMFEVLM